MLLVSRYKAMAPLIHVIYASSATAEFHEKDIPGLLKKARVANEKAGLTGMLLYIGESFFQVLEGESAAVDSVFAKISRDTRHARVKQIIREPIMERQFSSWTMGFSTIERLKAGKLLGENDFFDTASCITRLDASRAKTLLAKLNQKRWQLERSGMYRALGRTQ